MAALWPLSRSKEYDLNGDPIVGATAYFYNVGTTTPQTVYSDPSLSSAYTTDNPVETDGYGRWPAVYLSPDPGSYRQRVYDADDALLFDDDDVDVPQAADYTPPDAGDTAEELLFQTGDIKIRHGTGAITGFVRAAGRTIGSATSGAAERANADCEDLFLHLWGADSTLSVSGGRGANAASDWAANKTIALPDYRSRALVGLADMGNTALTILAGNTVDNSETVSTLGATLGAGEHTLTTAQIPSHLHTVDPPSTTTSSDGAHTHTHTLAEDFGNSNRALRGTTSSANTMTTSSEGAHTHTLNIAEFNSGNTGGGSAHPNAQPSVLLTIYIKL